MTHHKECCEHKAGTNTDILPPGPKYKYIDIRQDITVPQTEQAKTLYQVVRWTVKCIASSRYKYRYEQHEFNVKQATYKQDTDRTDMWPK